MSHPAPQTDGIDGMMNNVIAAARSNREEMMQAWSRGCDMYVRYFEGLAKAQGPEDLFATSADFALSAAEEMSHGMTNRRLNGAATADSKL
jgi:hypothetical protein